MRNLIFMNFLCQYVPFKGIAPYRAEVRTVLYLAMKSNFFVRNFLFLAVMFLVLWSYSVQALGGGPDKEWVASAEKGNAWDQLHLGQWYESKRDYSEAARWFSRSAGQGNVAAKYHLGVLYENGQGVSQDYVKAAKWYQAAAEHGNIPAEERLGALSESDQGIMKDRIEAYMWFYIAAAQHNREAMRHRDALEKILTSTDITAGRRVAHQWMQEHPPLAGSY